jgi:DNA-directed RNA polymerase sigma subunit (sigma70/sigma32)
MKIDVDLKSGFLQSIKREVLQTLTPEERAVIEVSTGEMGNKPDAVKLGWLKMRTRETWTKQRYVKALNRTMKKLRAAVEAESGRRSEDKS